jgi:histidinol-phosphate/aromatic aminotransferase/cobyric acid decarboxylase-like protein
VPVIPPPGAHGGDGARIAEALGLAPDEVLDLSASLNPIAPPLTDLLARHAGALRRYPDVTRATQALASCLGVDPARVVLTNGGAEAISLLGGLVGGSVVEPDFGLYPRSGGPRWRSNPHSPSGLLAPADLDAGVWDEAFWPLATGTWTRGDADRGRWVLGSLTKLFACPGLRAGYALAPDAGAAAELRARQPAWSVNGLVGDALPELLDGCDLPSWSCRVTELRADLVAVLRAAGYEPTPSDACWVLVPAPGLRDHLARRAIAVRDCASFGLPDTVRIAVPDGPGLTRLQEALP